MSNWIRTVSLVKAIRTRLHRQFSSTPNGDLLKPTDTFISSYPRSGNTWARILATDVILQLHGFETATELPIHQDKVIPSISRQGLDNVDDRLKLPYRLITSHDVELIAGRRAVYIFRSAADALCSYYHFHLRQPDLREAALQCSVDYFCLEHLDDWGAHVSRAIQLKETGQSELLMMSYEQLLNDTINCLKSIMSFIGFDATDNMLRRAVDNHTFEKQRSKERLGDNQIEYFFRKGKVGSAAEELQPETFSQIESRTQTMYERALAFTKLSVS